MLKLIKEELNSLAGVRYYINWRRVALHGTGIGDFHPWKELLEHIIVADNVSCGKIESLFEQKTLNMSSFNVLKQEEQGLPENDTDVAGLIS
ncbi:hypothetical protein NDU88_004775 [Pleurodeles waltl]|uniref:Uncharacterized protein n=1 Tax=Pleurodeles waltl TaxID=8319 RepID=A0AAV7RHT4_PLEWA|nr:hypothetical protein NDU88_004775 [Pleurodeles waltl]